jgi:hypothetical protein
LAKEGGSTKSAMISGGPPEGNWWQLPYQKNLNKIFIYLFI